MRAVIKTALAATFTSIIIGLGAANAATVWNDGASDFNDVNRAYRGVGTHSFNFNSAGGSNAISFDLFGANSIDGAGNGYDDLFTVRLNGTDVFSGFFNMSGGGANVFTSSLGWVANTLTNPGGHFKGGVTSVYGLVDLLAGTNVFSVNFSSPGWRNKRNQGLRDESWALNNVEVSPVPLPAALPLLLTALAGLGAFQICRRKLKLA